MPNEDSQLQQSTPLPSQDNKVHPTDLQKPASPLKPNKNVIVPKYDLITEGYDPDKLKELKER